jgi:hypothetical protein
MVAWHQMHSGFGSVAASAVTVGAPVGAGVVPVIVSYSY